MLIVVAADTKFEKTDFPHQMKDAQGLYRLWFSPADNLIGLNRGHVQRSRILFCSASRKASGYAVGRTCGGEIQIRIGHGYRHFGRLLLPVKFIILQKA